MVCFSKFNFVTLPFGYASFGRISGVASTIAGLVQLTMSEVVDRTERGGAPFPAGMSPKRRWQLVDFGLAVIPTLLLVQPFTALLAGLMDAWTLALGPSMDRYPSIFLLIIHR